MNKLGKFLNTFSHFIWPQHCPVCGMVAVSHCSECLGSAISPLEVFCLDCGGPFGVNCCDNSVPCYAASLHDGSARDFILLLKYSNVRNLGLPMGRLLGRTFLNLKADFVIPVPLHKSSTRAYNQSYLLALGISEELSVPASGDLLRWEVEVGTQMGKAGQARTAIPTNAISSSVSLKNKRVILVDDVYTTGSTLRAARCAVECAEGVVAGAIVWSRRLTSPESQDAWKGIYDEEYN